MVYSILWIEYPGHSLLVVVLLRQTHNRRNTRWRADVTATAAAVGGGGGGFLPLFLNNNALGPGAGFGSGSGSAEQITC